MEGMVNVALLVLGLAMLLTVVTDALATTLTVRAGAGPLTQRLTASMWRVLLRLHRRDRESSLLGLAGPALLMVTVLVWVGLLWAGWTLVFLSGDRLVIESGTGVAANTAQVVYYVAFTIFTLGVGDYVPAGDGWRVATSVATFSGLFLVTLAITYLVSVVSAVVQRRALAVQVHALGSAAGVIVARGWNGEAFSSAFLQQLTALTGQLATIGEQHLAYPVLHFFHTADRHTSASVAIAALDDAMLVMSAAVAPADRPDDSVVRPVREVISRYVETAVVVGVATDVDAPPDPDLAPVTAAGIPVVSEAALAAAADEQAERRRNLRRLVEGDGWSWTS